MTMYTIGSLIGVALNYFSIIVLGDYNPAMFPDGHYQEDSSIYDWAYMVAYQIGTIPLVAN